ncbi:response regulator [Kineosporia sp. J2-2]|uniref:Response regulator n=1 Tax=Kineosporia corallincola TaxID=2835133 RepID=A0ABS5TQ90_9ACTN|nr:BTAD domain-containing putative transcriptional regulator [Kineosporia corallincola]MBT0773256.1 response regulator [Kineosporia corallincola]
MTLDFRLLGRVEVRRDGEPVDIGGPKQRAVLASLLMRPRRVVPVEQLIDDLWPERPPARAVATVQVFVSQLRRALEPGRSRGQTATVLVTASPGYLLDVDPATVDAHRLTDLVTRGRAARDAGEPARAAELLAGAERLWQGPPLADVPDTPFVRTTAAGLTELRLGAADDRADAELALGRHAALIAELEQRAHRHPLRERVREQLMLALYRCGRQVEALAVYRATHQTLCRDLGLEPGVRLRDLEQAILRQDPALTWRPDPQLPAPRAGGDPGRVLVVDDTAINRKLLATAVTNLGHRAETAPDGHRALEMLREAGGAAGGFDVVLLDLLMPVLDGYATLAQIKADPALASVPVIMVSAVPELESVVRCIELGAVDYLPKPYSSALLKARLHASLHARRSATERESVLHNEIAALRAQVGSARAVSARVAGAQVTGAQVGSAQVVGAVPDGP